MTSVDVLQAHFKNEREIFLNMLDSIIILDIGIINSVSPDGRADVTSSTFINNVPIKYSDAEVIYPGNANGCYTAACPGMACLIFLPKSCMPKISDLKLRVGTTSYNRDGVKVMPIGNGANNKVQAFFSASGDYNIIGQSYNAIFTGDDVTLQRKDERTSVTMDGTGQLYIKKDNLSIAIEDTGITKTYVSNEQDVVWTDKTNPDGSRTFIQTDDQDNVLSSVTIDPDGTMTIHSAADVSVSSEGDASIQAKGDVNIQAEGDVNIQADGDITTDATTVKLNGDSESLVTYAALNTALSTFLQKLTLALQAATYVNVSGTPTPLTWTSPIPDSIDISNSETSSVKTGG